VPECPAVTPPGHFTTTAVNGTGNTTKCLNGEYRAEWKPASAADKCDICGANILSEETDQITTYDIETEIEGVVDVATTSGACCE
jgi:hypothetical protein